MSRSNLNTSCSKCYINHLISNNYHFSIRNERMLKMFAYELLISLVIRMDSYCAISEHCLDTSCGNLNELCRVILEQVSKSYQDSELNFFVIPWDFK